MPASEATGGVLTPRHGYRMGLGLTSILMDGRAALEATLHSWNCSCIVRHVTELQSSPFLKSCSIECLQTAHAEGP